MNLLITGARGFIGRHLAQYLAAQGGAVSGIGHGAISPDGLEQMRLSFWINGDVDHANLQQLNQQRGPIDCIFHLAGGSHVGKSFESPHEDFHRTVTAASQLFEWVRLNSPQTPVVVVSSAAVYGSGHAGPIAEDATLNPFSPYGAHKAMLETLSRSYCDNFGLRMAVCRLFSVYGEGLEKQLIFDLCRKCSVASEHESISLGGTGQELRDWLHVSDVSRFLWMIRKHCSSDCLIVNGASGAGTSVADIAKLVIESWGLNIEPCFSGLSRPGDPVSLVADTSKAKSLGFVPNVSLADGFQRVTSWYRSSHP